MSLHIRRSKGERKRWEGESTHVSTILRLQILMRIPIGVEDDDRVGCLQVETETSGPRREDEDRVLRVGLVEEFEQRATVFVLRRTVEPQVLDSSEVEVVFENRHDGLERASGSVRVHTLAVKIESRRRLTVIWKNMRTR